MQSRQNLDCSYRQYKDSEEELVVYVAEHAQFGVRNCVSQLSTLPAYNGAYFVRMCVAPGCKDVCLPVHRNFACNLPFAPLFLHVYAVCSLLKPTVYRENGVYRCIHYIPLLLKT